MSNVVLDASAMLAILNQEPGGRFVYPGACQACGDLVAQTSPLGLSLGDRACLALGLALKAPVYTADKSWKKVKVGARIHVIR